MKLPYLSHGELIERYDKHLDEEATTIASMSYSTSVALKKVDPTAYGCGLRDYAEFLAGYNYAIEGYLPPEAVECDKCGSWYDDEEERDECSESCD